MNRKEHPVTTAIEVTTAETGACCAPLLAAPLPAQDAGDLASAFKALADPVRLRLLSLIASAADGEACSCDLEEPVGKSQPTVSHHLAVLADAGLITKRKAGRWVMCRVVPERLDALRDALARS
jgi:ArsR family transcriptional regulator, arsenate/arsenite/antimonite-responsive transcriptional repressor